MEKLVEVYSDILKSEHGSVFKPVGSYRYSYVGNAIEFLNAFNVAIVNIVKRQGKVKVPGILNIGFKREGLLGGMKITYLINELPVKRSRRDKIPVEVTREIKSLLGLSQQETNRYLHLLVKAVSQSFTSNLSVLFNIIGVVKLTDGDPDKDYIFCPSVHVNNAFLEWKSTRK